MNVAMTEYPNAAEVPTATSVFMSLTPCLAAFQAAR